MKYPAVFFEDGEYIGVEFPDLPGCFSQGKNLAEAVDNASKALADFLGAYVEMPDASDITSLNKNADTLAIKFVDCAKSSADTHEIMYNEKTNRLVAFPKNQDFLGDKLCEKIKKAAGL